MGRRVFRILSAVALVLAIGLVAPIAALAHPLGNFTINHYAGITVSPTAVHLDIVIDMAEIPAFQERQLMDTDRDGTVNDSEAAAGAATDCTKLVASIRLARDGAALALSPTTQAMSFPPGAGGLSTLRLECGFELAGRSKLPRQFRRGSRCGHQCSGWRQPGPHPAEAAHSDLP